MKADFGTLATLFGLLLNSAGLGALGSLLNRQEFEGLVKDLREAIGINWGDDRADAEYVTKKLTALRAQLFSVWMFLLHLVNIGILVALVIILVIGPGELFSPEEGELAESLTPVQLILYWLWCFTNLIAYVVKGVSPTIQWWRLSRQAKEWLKTHEIQPRRKYG